MARSPVQPGPPPRHYRAPGMPPAPGGSRLPLGSAMAPIPPRAGLSGNAAAAIGIVTLLVGLAIGILVGRASVESGDGPVSAPPITSAPTLPRDPSATIPPGPSAPPGTDLPPQQLGTVDSPIPAGDAYVIGIYTIEVLGFDDDATDEVLAASNFNEAPRADERRVLVEMRVTYNERSGLGNAAAIPFTLTDGDDEWVDVPPTCGIVPDDLQTTGLLGPGETVEGNVCFTVPDAAVESGLSLFTDGFAGNLYFQLPA